MLHVELNMAVKKETIETNYTTVLWILQVIKPKLARPGRVPVTTCAWDREGKSIVGGIGDGSIQVLACDIWCLFCVSRSNLA